MSDRRPNLLVITAVMPYPGIAGQQQRVKNTLRAVRESFTVTIITFAPEAERGEVQRRLQEFADRAVVLPSRYHRSRLARSVLAAAGTLWTWSTGLKFSNFVVGRLELTEARIEQALRILEADGAGPFDLALYEYWHAVGSVPALRRRSVPTVLDMHNLLWRARARQLGATRLPGWLKARWMKQYRAREEASWEVFDALISINRDEDVHARNRVPDTPVLFAPMGTDMQVWTRPDGAGRAEPPRIAYYGGLGTSHNQQDALECYRDVMPRIWKTHPHVEFWIVGSRPPEALRRLPREDSRVTVTGFVEDAPALLSRMTAVLCPWTGTYGFRSRLVEVMAVETPVIASTEAVAGMDLVVGEGLILADDPVTMAKHAVALLDDPAAVTAQGQAARSQVEARYSIDTTYGRLAEDLLRLAGTHAARRPRSG